MLTIVLARDKGSGSVRLDGAGRPRLYYPLSKHDRHSLMAGTELAIRISASAGAESITTGQRAMGKIERLPGIEHEEAREAAVDALVQKSRGIGIKTDFTCRSVSFSPLFVFYFLSFGG